MGCGVAFMAARAQALPWGPGLRGCDDLASGGVQFLLGYFCYMCNEVGELLGFGGVELGCELVLKS